MDGDRPEKQRRKKPDKKDKARENTQKQNVTFSTTMSMNVYINRSVQSLSMIKFGYKDMISRRNKLERYLKKINVAKAGIFLMSSDFQRI